MEPRTQTRHSLLALPVLMLPLLAGAVWLAAGGQHPSAQAMVILGAVAFAWYLLGGALAAAAMVRGMRLRRDLRRAGRVLASTSEPGWIVDPQGFVHAQNQAARQFGELAGRPVSELSARFVAAPIPLAERLTGGAALGRRMSVDLGEHGRLEAVRLAGSQAQLWQIRQVEPQAQRRAGPTLASIPVALLELDREGLVLDANPAADALLEREARGLHLGELLDGLGRPLVDWLTAVAEGRTLDGSEVLYTRGDTDRPVQVTLGLRGDGEGLVAVLSDASALRRLEAQFVQSQKMQAIGQLAGGIAHDFNNLLTAISGHCDLLMLRRDKMDPDYADLSQISDNANRAAALVKQLLAFSRKQTLQPEVIDLRDTLADLTHLLNRLVGERVALTFIHDPLLRPVRADKRQIEQVIMNLVVNARDAMPDGGSVTITTANVNIGADAGDLPVQMPRGDYVRVQVADSGCGIAPDQLEKIYDPFFTTKRPGEGTGLGLATAYGIVKQTGGYIFCDSVVGEGTTFTLFFPAQRTMPRPVREPAPRAALPMVSERHIRVMLVEDEAAVRAFAARALRLRGMEVIEFGSGESALEWLAAERGRVDLFMSDVVMPGLDGPGWVRKALETRPRTPVVFMSGYTELPLAEDAAPVPGALFLAKPFSLTDLIAKVEAHLAEGEPSPSEAALKG